MGPSSGLLFLRPFHITAAYALPTLLFKHDMAEHRGHPRGSREDLKKANFSVPLHKG